MRDAIFQYFKCEKFILLDRAFLGLFVLFKLIKLKTDKKKILFTSTTCPSPVFAAQFAGLIPVFVDINLNNFLMDYELVKDRVQGDSDIAAVVYIYTYGHISSDIFKLKKLVKEENIYLIEDVAQAFGAEIDGIKAGEIGDAAVFSFGYSKQIDVGKGGLLLLNSDKFDKKNVNRVLENMTRFNINSNLIQDYKEDFYKNRKVVIFNKKKYYLFSKFAKKYKQMYFKKIEVNWEQIKELFLAFIRKNKRTKRNRRAFKYHNHFLNCDYRSQLILPVLKNNYSVYRYTFLVKNKNDAQYLSKYLRNRNIHCSNLYLSVSRFYYNRNFINSVKLAERVINLWVDEIADEDYIEKTLDVVDSYFNTRN